MNIIPAIDIMDQRVVRLKRGEFGTEKVYSENPVKVAEGWKDCGAQLLHIVDLDGARLGKPVNLDIIREITHSVKIDVEVGGGLRSEADIDKAFRAAAHFVVIGTSAVQDETFVKSLVQKFKDKIIFAVDAKDGYVAMKGWKEVSGESILEYAQKLESLGAKKIIYTDISRDGMLEGPDLEILKSILESTSLKVTASGGISSINDIKQLKKLEEFGLTAVIIGKALYEGRIDFREALRAG
ncbi:MAG: 1-(5-phosphoribosyl)-5-[(5-phosphoribosylamino)methylideneamino]imidazole-4-carboxamide isomerase [Omnitrophica bacterium]|nr:1-(5-phosphoribosyl)-5-[(5-phosphoribosylamino)methylideneamino]imidazole-4-carboxamide isomerase [Candidatus Omnitrophota bacterium]